MENENNNKGLKKRIIIGCVAGGLFIAVGIGIFSTSSVATNLRVSEMLKTGDKYYNELEYEMALAKYL